MKARVEVPLVGRRGAGLFAIVDASDADLVLGRRWHAAVGRTGPMYARSGFKTASGYRWIAMHTVITGLSGMDHANGDGLDNRRTNLRLANKSSNAANQQKRTGTETSSVYKGVTWRARRGKWQAALCVEGRTRYLGVFVDEMEAASAYDEAAREHFGEFAAVNLPVAGERSCLSGGAP